MHFEEWRIEEIIEYGELCLSDTAPDLCKADHAFRVALAGDKEGFPELKLQLRALTGLSKSLDAQGRLREAETVWQLIFP